MKKKEINSPLCSLFNLIGMFDQDGSSTIDFQEFRALWRYVTEWEKCFRFAFF